MDPQNQLQNKKDTSDKQNKGVENQISGDQAELNNDYTNITAGPIQNHIRGEIITLLPNEKYLILKKNTDKLAKATDQHTTLQCALYNKSLEINDGDLIQADYLPIKDSSDYEYVIVKVLKKSGEKSKPKKPRKYQSILKKPSLIGKPSTIVNNYNNNKGSKAQEQNQPAIDYKTIDINALQGEEKHTALNRLQFQLEVEEKQLDIYQQSMKQKRPKAPPKPVPDQAQSSIRSLISQRSKQSIIKRAGPIGSVFVTKSQIKKEQSKIEGITSIDHSMPLKDLCQKLGIKDLEKGLGHQDAKNKITEFGENKLPDKKRTPGWIIFIHELLTWFSLMLWGGCILSFIGYGLDTSNGLGNVYFAIIIIIIVIITAIITYMQNAKSEALMDSFKNMLPSTCYVLREGTVTSVDPTQLVPGDIISVKAGDKVPADIRVIYSNEMKVDNSPLTGEAIPLLRSDQCTHPDFMESANMAFFGTVVTEGRGKGIVVKTGSKTVLGEIALEVSGDKKQKTPLRNELDRFVIMISFIAIGLCVIFFFAARFVVGYSWVDSMIFGIGILLANVPEGLLGCITISLAITAEILAKKQVLVKNLEGVETLGSTSCICSDKTGTLTQNKMTVEHIWYDSKIRRGDNLQIKPKDFNFEYKPTDVTFTELQICAVTSSEAVFQVPEADFDKTTWLHAPVKGDASETALVKFFQPIEYIEKTRQEHPFAKTERGENAVMPFNSTNKFAMTIIEQLTEESHYTVYIKGAPEKIWTLCTYLMHEGQPQEINKQLQKLFQNVQLEFMNNGERVLGFAQLRLDRQKYPEGFEFDVSHVEKFNFEFKDFTFLGLISLQDPPKPAVPHAVEKCKSAGIKVIMVTGDSPPTAAAISKQVNIIPSNMKTNLDIMIEMEEKGEKITWQQATAQADAIVINGDQINQQLAQDNKNRKEGEPENDYGIQQWVRKPYCVFARTTPQHKLKIVQACQRVGYIVGVTGDGVNDSPAIKQGDIGISMGITGSDVTKDAADMVLLNDDFASIIDGIQEGRKIFDNLKKTIVYLLTSNVTQIIPFIAQLIFLLPLPLSTMLMLTISAGTDILPALSFAYECAEIDIMTRRPRTKNEHMVTVRLITHAYLQMGFISTAAGFFAYFSTMYYYGFKMNGLFGLTGSDVVIAKRGDLIPFGSYNPNLPNLGNPYLNNDCRENGKSENFAYALTDNTGEKDDWENLDWTFQRDEQYDLRQIIVECDKDTGNWITKEDVFKQCEGIDNSDDIGFAQMIENAENDSSVNFPSLSTQEHTYKYYQTENNQKSYKTKVPVCYSTEALKWAQSAYFVAIVLVQWSNIISVKAKKVSFIYTPWNRFMLYGVILETAIAIFLCYTPGVQLVFMTRPLLFVQWWCGSVFSIMLFIWCEIRKYLIRQSPIKGKQNFWAKNVMW